MRSRSKSSRPWRENILIIRSGSCWWEAWKFEWDRPRRARRCTAKSSRQRRIRSQKCGSLSTSKPRKHWSAAPDTEARRRDGCLPATAQVLDFMCPSATIRERTQEVIPQLRTPPQRTSVEPSLPGAFRLRSGSVLRSCQPGTEEEFGANRPAP